MLVVATIAIIGGVFFVYSMLQTSAPVVTPTRPPRVEPATRPLAGEPSVVARRPTGDAVGLSDAAVAQPAGPASPAAAPPAQRVIGAGDNVWVKTFDSKTGKLSNEFRAARYDPRPDDTVDVVSPEARFYLEDDAVLVLRANRGRVVIPSATGQQETLRSSRGQAPTRGELYDVTFSLHRAVDAPAVVSATMPNIVFDNDTYRLGTESYTDAAGNTVPAERVPITVRGEDYDFDGYGLTVRWNEVDRRLQLLEVNRGDRLVVKNPKVLKLSGPGDEPKSQAAQPIEVTWTGPLRVTPAKISRTLQRELYRAMLTDAVKVTQAGKQIADSDVLEVSFTLENRPKGAPAEQPPVVVSLTGKPAHVQLQGMTAEAAVVSYDSTTGNAELRSSAESALVRLNDASGRLILAQSLAYDAESAAATLAGPVRFDLPLNDERGKRLMRAEARQDCRLEFSPRKETTGGMTLRAARFRGNVVIEHPQIRLSSGALSLGFDETAPSDKPALTNLSADGGVSATLVDEKQQSQTIECDRLALVTQPNGGGEIVPRSLRAQGGVRIDSSQQQLSAGLIDLSFAPPGAKPPPPLIPAMGNVVITSLLAEQSVKMRSADGTSVNADRVTLEEVAGRRWLKLTGSPASLGDARGQLEAAALQMDADTGDAVIVGGGSFKTSIARREGVENSGQTATITWKDDLRLDSQSNRAQADGGVEIVAQQPDGTAIRGTAQRLELEFAPVAAGEKPAAPLAGRQMIAASLLGDVQLGSLKLNPDGSLLQRMHVFSERLEYLPDSGQISIPVPGRMLVEDRRRDEKPATDPLASPRGATAFQWSEQLRFIPSQGKADMIGDVVAVYAPQRESEKPLRVNADRVGVEFADSGSSAATQPSQLKVVTATGNVRFNSENLEFQASEVEFRPPDDVLIARGTERVPAVLLDDQGLSRGSFVELWLNTRTNESHLRDFRATVRR